MTPHPPARTKPDNTRWTGEKAADFLKLLASSGKVAPCARAVGMSRQAAYRLRAHHAAFCDAMERVDALPEVAPVWQRHWS